MLIFINLITYLFIYYLWTIINNRCNAETSAINEKQLLKLQQNVGCRHKTRYSGEL